MDDKKFLELVKDWQKLYPEDQIFNSKKGTLKDRLEIADYIERRKIRVCLEEILRKMK